MSEKVIELEQGLSIIKKYQYDHILYFLAIFVRKKEGRLSRMLQTGCYKDLRVSLLVRYERGIQECTIPVAAVRVQTFQE